MAPSISIFIVNYNTRALLQQCLKSVFENRGDLVVEVFVADNNSTDGSADMVEETFPGVYLKRHSVNMGFTKAVNPLLGLGQGEFYLILHPDLEVLPHTFRQFVDFFGRHPKIGILGGNLYYPDGTPNPCEILFPGFWNDLLCFAMRLFKRLPGGRKLFGNSAPSTWSHERTCRVNWVWNACMMVRRTVFDKIGYFDEDFFVWYADWDFCKRTWDAGWCVCYLGPATAVHHERQSYGRQIIASEQVWYKVDGWYSAPWMIRDRHVFLKKYVGPASIYGVKGISILENTLRLGLILGGLLSRRDNLSEASFHLRACFETLHAILKA
ncbi:MAG: glycosyltransferase family 2 protein [Thermodesulfobacteriota bacterium]|nr:glycosyltransferase family 2 protein [Thermodesulfobacteriota bacterium]